MTNEKLNTLAEFLEIEPDELKQSDYDESIFNYGNQEYLIVTDDEADERTAEQIKDSLWAFNSDFIIQHCKNFNNMDNYEFETAIKSLQYAQEHCCEGANGLVYALIDDIDEFIQDAIIADGRGHFISYYDGVENELNDLYIYRLN